ncbi:MAG: MoaD/ThiS family protein [Thermoanaerobaculaceae bacterium]|nr:MoaD/ThiS family protein [Thermoanaerobaculaceae bacterium]
MMTVYLKGGGLLREYLQPDVDEYTRRVEVAEGRTLRQILEAIGIRPVHVAMAFVGNRLVNLAYVPSDGETITLRPPVQGG